MTILEELHKTIDESNWDGCNNNLNKAFQEANDKIGEINDELQLRKSEIERWTFLFNKNPEKGLTYMTSGVKTLENGDEISFVFPDQNELTKEDFLHIKSRFENCKNLFAKTEYGLLLYYSGKLKNNKEVKILLESLLELAIYYYEKALLKEEKNHYLTYFRLVLGNGLKIADSRKNSPEIHSLLEELIKLNTKVHNTWDVKDARTLRPIIDLTDFALNYKKEFEKVVSLENYLQQNYKAAIELSKIYSWGCIYICDISQKLSDYLSDTQYDWQTLKAVQFENMIQPAIDSGNLAAVSFAEDALAIYKKLGNKQKIEELEKQYDEIRSIFRMGEVKQELPKDETQRINDIIKNEIENKSGQELIIILATTPMFSKLEQIRELADHLGQQSFLSNIIPSSIIDKFGNTVEVFASEEEKKQYNFWQTYEHNFQIGAQTLANFFIESIKSGKINYAEIEHFITDSWIGEKYNILYNGYENEICPYDVIEPALKLYFSELETWKNDNSYIPNFICSTDSLVSKTEYLMRFFCKIAGIATFTDKQKGPHKYKMEKNNDEILNSLKHSNDNPTGFSEEHRVFIQFILSQKIGLNLRHRVAHGLMDANEYSFMNPLYIILIILKIAKYKFKNGD